jgi:hypothetical protein
MISVSINASVGEKGKNLEKDVKTITALINVYRRSLNQAAIPISTKSSTDLEISYDGLVKDVKRICADAGNVTEYGAVDWDNLDSAIKDVTVDLRFRGDYTRASRKNIQKSIADNDLKEFKKQLKDSTKWPGVPQDRFDRRVKFLGN